MMGIDTQTSHHWSIASLFGYEHPLFILNTETIIHTWALLMILALSCILCHLILRQHSNLRQMLLVFIASVSDSIKQSLGTYSLSHFVFISTLFIFIALANTLSIFPWLDEPTTDINTAFALGISAFVYTQYAAITSVGLMAYLKSFFSPFFIMFPLNIIAKISSIISLAFRLFGNIAGGSIIFGMYLMLIRHNIYGELFGIGVFGAFIAIAFKLYQRAPLIVIIQSALFALLLSSNMLMTLFFTVFEGCLQAFVFTMLSLTYLSNALQGEGH